MDEAAKLLAENTRLRADVAELRDFLEDRVWEEGMGIMACRECGSQDYSNREHKPGCKLHALLERTKRA